MSLSPGGPDLAPLSSLDDPLRRRLYEVVTSRPGPVSRDEAASAAGIGRALAVYHLDKLVESGLLTAFLPEAARAERAGAGRPAKLYARSDREFAVTVPPREYELAARLLVQAVEADPSDRSRAALAEAARLAGHRAGRSIPAGRGGRPARWPGHGQAGREGRADPARIRALPRYQRRHPAAELPVPPAHGAAQRGGLRNEPRTGGGAGRGPRRGRLACGSRPAARSLLRRDRR